MVDFHSHVLPGMDDGSKSIEESLRMLAASARQGVSYMAATSHFYPSENSPEQFLARRDQAVAELQAVWRPEFPKLLLGAEVYYFDGISRSEGVEALRIEGTSLLLLEMPFHTWSNRMVAEIEALQNRPGFTVLLAHIERYLHLQGNAVWAELREAGVLMQSNASFFRHWSTKHKAIHMLDAGQIHLLGSDCHNMLERAPRLGEAVEMIGEQRYQIVERRSRALLALEEAVH